MTIKVSVVGATGRMGKLAIDIINGAADLELHSAIDSKTELEMAAGSDVIFEATNLEVSQKVVDFGLSNGINVLVASSGWTSAALAEVKTKATGSAVVVIPNFSIGSTLASRFAAEAAKFYDSIEIIETHHAGKKDSPSGTAIRTAELIAQSRNEANRDTPLIQGVGQEARGQVVAGVPIHSLRLDGVSAKQEVNLGGTEEVLSIVHQTASVKAYALGILHSIRFTANAQGLVVGLDKVLGI